MMSWMLDSSVMKVPSGQVRLQLAACSPVLGRANGAASASSKAEAGFTMPFTDQSPTSCSSAAHSAPSSNSRPPQLLASPRDSQLALRDEQGPCLE